VGTGIDMSNSGMTDLNDADILRLEGVLRHLHARQGTSVSLEGFRKEARDRFAEVGFRVEVKTYDTPTAGIFAFEIEIRERLEGEFDPDQMVHEATNDLLGLGTKGVITTNGGLWTPPSHTRVSR